jgi:hypothetical protein
LFVTFVVGVEGEAADELLVGAAAGEGAVVGFSLFA